MAQFDYTEAGLQEAANRTLGPAWNREGQTFWADDSQYYMRWDEGSQQFVRAESPGEGGRTWVDSQTGIEMRDTGTQGQIGQSTLSPNYTQLPNGNAGITVNGQVKDTGRRFQDVPASFSDYTKVLAVFGSLIAGATGINALTGAGAAAAGAGTVPGVSSALTGMDASLAGIAEGTIAGSQAAAGAAGAAGLTSGLPGLETVMPPMEDPGLEQFTQAPPAVTPPVTPPAPTTTVIPPTSPVGPLTIKDFIPIVPVVTSLLPPDKTTTTTGTDAASTAARIAQEQWDYYKTNYQPVETRRIARAMDSDSPEAFARARGAANADVTGAFNRAGRQTQSRMQTFGINPGSPAYQATMGSVDLAQGAATAGALTGADRYTRQYSDALLGDVVNTGKGIPSQAVSGLTGAANSATYAGNAAFNQNQTTQQNIGRGLSSGLDLIDKWFSRSSGIPNTTPQGGEWEGYADGGMVIDAEKTGPGTYDATTMATTLQRHGLSPAVATTQAHAAVGRHKQTFTPHVRLFAAGGGVGRQGMAGGMDMSNIGMDASMAGQIQGPGTETSDSIPATIDNGEPAQLSSGEFVMSAPVMDMTGEEIMTIINNAALRKRGQGLEPQTTAPMNAEMQAYRGGGRVRRFAGYGMGG